MPKVTAVGTGLIIDPSDVIVAKYHVAGCDASIDVTQQDGRKFKAKRLGSDKTDSGVPKINSDKLPVG